MTNPNDPNDLIANLQAMTENEFEPTEQQQRAKIKLLTMTQDNPLFSLEDLSCEEAIRLTRERKLKTWWSVPGFQDWFKNKGEFRQQLEELISSGMRTARRILNSNDARMAGAQVNILKLLFEAGNRMPAKQKEVKFSDETINKMDPLQLEDFLRKAGYVRLEAVATPEEPQLLRESKDGNFTTEETDT